MKSKRNSPSLVITKQILNNFWFKNSIEFCNEIFFALFFFSATIFSSPKTHIQITNVSDVETNEFSNLYYICGRYYTIRIQYFQPGGLIDIAME